MLLPELAGGRELDSEPKLLSPDGHGRMVSDRHRCSGGPAVPVAPSETARTLLPMRRLRTLSETECYVRLYGGWDPAVTLVKVEPRRPRYDLAVSGEDLRRDFELRIDARTEELLAELDAAEAAAEAA